MPTWPDVGCDLFFFYVKRITIIILRFMLFLSPASTNPSNFWSFSPESSSYSTEKLYISSLLYHVLK